jgi:hypothetical protein
MKTKNTALVLLIMTLILLSAYSTTAPIAAPLAVPTKEIPFSEGLQIFKGEGFSFQ